VREEGELTLTEIFYTVHAQRKMADRKVSCDEVELTIVKPETAYRGTGDRPDSKIYQRGTLAVVVKPIPEGVLVITILWRTSEKWDDSSMGEKR
jgi:hypothetical protein